MSEQRKASSVWALYLSLSPSCFKRINSFVLTFAWRLKREPWNLEAGQGIKASKTREESMKRKHKIPQTKQAWGRSA